MGILKIFTRKKIQINDAPTNKTEQEEINMVKACSCCGMIVWNQNSQWYKENYCGECKSRNIPNTLVELPISCEEYKQKLYVKKRESDREIRKYLTSINTANKELFDTYVKKWDTLDKTTESYKLNVAKLNNNGINPIYTTKKKKTNTTTQNIPKCPTCGSTDIFRLGVVDRAVSVGFLGASSNKINKTFECKKCKYTW